MIGRNKYESKESATPGPPDLSLPVTRLWMIYLKDVCETKVSGSHVLIINTNTMLIVFMIQHIQLNSYICQQVVLYVHFLERTDKILYTNNVTI